MRDTEVENIHLGATHSRKDKRIHVESLLGGKAFPVTLVFGTSRSYLVGPKNTLLNHMSSWR